MTGSRRRATKKSSKKESPEKTRRSTRRRAQKSDSEPEDSGSDASPPRNCRDNDETKASTAENSETVKGDESGGSDGAWHVRSENGNKGGIPKLKLCLQRPAELSSPSSDPLPSPRPRRSRRGCSPSQDNSESAVEDVPSVDGSLKKAEGDEIQAEDKSDNAQETVLQTTDQDSAPAPNESIPETNEAVVQIASESSPTEQNVGTQEEETERATRPPSRDSSEERAKEEALRSRKRKKKEGSEEGEVVESPERSISFPSRSGTRIRTTGCTGLEDTKDASSSQDVTPAPVVRKRRWGSSNNRTSKTPVSISTDVLKEIIPGAKPVALSEVHLSPNHDEKMDEEENPDNGRRGSRLENARKLSNAEDRSSHNYVSERKRPNVPSDESEKDYEEEVVDSGGEEMVKKDVPFKDSAVVHSPEKADVTHTARKVALVADPIATLKKPRSPSPPSRPVSNVLYITGLVRPFTVPQLRDLLARTGEIAEDGFWIDKIKSRCYVKYTNEDDAKTTRHALHGVRWPASNPKNLRVDFGTEEQLKVALDGGKPINTEIERDDAKLSIKRLDTNDLKNRDVEDKMKDRERARDERPRHKERDRERTVRVDDRERKVRVENDRDRSDRPVRKVTTIPVREWDLGKAERGFSPPPIHFEDRRVLSSDDRKKREKERSRRSSSLEPIRKVKKKEDGPTKILLEDLFRKTKATPCIYWLPLTAEQITVREEMRRKHMAEHEKKLAEQRRRQEAKRRRPRTKSRSRSRSSKK